MKTFSYFMLPRKNGSYIQCKPHFGVQNLFVSDTTCTVHVLCLQGFDDFNSYANRKRTLRNAL